MDVTDVLRDRMHEPGGYESMAATMSLLGHGMLVAAVIFAPGFLPRSGANAPTTVMTISLGGGEPGPTTAGRTAEGGRPVQAVKPPEEAAKPEAVRPPAARTPEMTLPEKNAKPQKSPPAPVKQAPDDARGHTPTRGAEARAGTAAAETAVRGQGFGLASGGGGGFGSYLDVSDFCCPEYLQTMAQRIRANWSQRVGATGDVIVKFTIQRDGQITEIAVEQSSGNAILDLNAQRALHVTRQLPALPAQFPNPTLTVHLDFKYQ